MYTYLRTSSKFLISSILILWLAAPLAFAEDMHVSSPDGAGAKTVKLEPVAHDELDDDLDDELPTFTDPYEGLNRAVFTFNDFVDNAVLKPLATLYQTIIPSPISQCVTNFYNNIRTIPTIANDVLQLHLYQALNDSWRLGINTTIGIGGLFDVATKMGLPIYKNDFGLTLARWGYSSSNYLVIPFFGPGSFRDLVGLPVDYYLFSIYPRINPERDRFAIYGLGVIDRRAQLLKFQNVLEEAALDEYVFIRNAFMQRRSFELEQNQQMGFLTKTVSGDNSEEE